MWGRGRRSPRRRRGRKAYRAAPEEVLPLIARAKMSDEDMSPTSALQPIPRCRPLDATPPDAFVPAAHVPTPIRTDNIPRGSENGEQLARCFGAAALDPYIRPGSRSRCSRRGTSRTPLSAGHRARQARAGVYGTSAAERTTRRSTDQPGDRVLHARTKGAQRFGARPARRSTPRATRPDAAAPRDSRGRFVERGNLLCVTRREGSVRGFARRAPPPVRSYAMPRTLVQPSAVRVGCVDLC